MPLQVIGENNMPTVADIVFKHVNGLEERSNNKLRGFFAFFNYQGDYIGYDNIDKLDRANVREGVRLDINDTIGPYFYFRLDGDISYDKTDRRVNVSSVGTYKRNIPLRLVFYIPKGDRFALEELVISYVMQHSEINLKSYNLEPYSALAQEFLIEGNKKLNKPMLNIAVAYFDLNIIVESSTSPDCIVNFCSSC